MKQSLGRKVAIVFFVTGAVLYFFLLLGFDWYLYSFPRRPVVSRMLVIPWNYRGGVHYITPFLNNLYDWSWDLSPAMFGFLILAGYLYDKKK